MKKVLLTVVFMFSVSSLFSQETLRHFNPQEITPIVETYPDNGGYLTGHNTYGDEEFAEKYEISGSGKIHGVAAIHTGQAGSSAMNASYRIYNVKSNGLPNVSLANKNVPYNDIPVDGSLFTVNFNSPVQVSNQFFVSFRLGDYVHENPGTKRIAITHAPDGTRPESDFAVYGRNVVRWHSHGGTVWKDYRTENFTDYQPAVYLSLFPIVELENMSVVDFNKKGSVGAVYPNPSSGKFTIPIKTSAGGEATFKLFDMSGKQVVEKQAGLSLGKTDFLFSEEKLQPGAYILMIKTPEGTVSQKISIQ